MYPWYWFFPYYYRRRRRRSLLDKVEERLSEPQKAAGILALVAGFPFLMVGTVLFLFWFIGAVLLEPGFWFLILAFIIWGLSQKKK